MQYFYCQVKKLFLISILTFVIFFNIECNDNFIKGKPIILYNISDDIFSSKITPPEENLSLKLPNNDKTTQSIPTSSEEQTVEPFIFTTFSPSISPFPPGIDLIFDKALETTTSNNPTISTTTSNVIELSTINDDFNLDNDDVTENSQINVIINPTTQSPLSNTTDTNISEGVNSFNNFEVSDQYASSFSNEIYLSTTISTTTSIDLQNTSELNILDEDKYFSNVNLTSTMAPKMTTEDIFPTTESTPIDIKPKMEEIQASISDKSTFDEYNNNNSIESNNTNMIKKSCPKVEICNPGCGISIDLDGCQKCTCLWIPKFCIETSDCNGSEYICDYGKCLCGINYTQDMERSGVCIPSPNDLGQNEI
uniref:Antistasin-like domain-containing protein n=1 Tax=Strongyloides stercoralis TaxID=6248 RepID=A0A0K0E134_STRER